LKNAEKVLAIELMSAAQALDFRRPARSSERVEELITAFRKEVDFVKKDRVLHDDMMKAVAFIQQYEL
jgi:histidine ammonia-lyase